MHLFPTSTLNYNGLQEVQLEAESTHPKHYVEHALI